MRFHSAIYGEVNGGHALRAASGDDEFARNISGRLDLPSNPPTGVGWSPTVSGFPVQGRYVVARTFLDTNASRSNMVLTHAMFAPIEQIRSFCSLSALFRRLATQLDLVPAPSEMEVGEADDLRTSPELLEAAELLVARGRKPVVKLDSDGFEEIVSVLWRNLWPDMRQEFSFRLSFTPEDVYEDPGPAIVWTPKALAARWHGYPILGHSQIRQSSRASAVIAGVADPSDLLNLADEIGLQKRNLSALVQLVAVSELVGPSSGVEDLAAALRLVDRLSPSPIEGGAIKRDLVERLAKEIAGADALQILGLRNLRLPGVADLQVLWRAIGDWMAAQPLQTDTMVFQIADIVASSQDANDAIEPWRKAVGKGGGELSTRRPGEFSHAFWSLLAHRPQLGPPLVSFVPKGAAGEKLLLAALPADLDCDLGPLRPVLVEREWLRLHGAVLAASASPFDAVRQQLSVDKDADFEAGLQAALKKATASEAVSIAVFHGDLRLASIAGRLASDKQELLLSLDYSLPSAQKVWFSAMQSVKNSWQGPADPFEARNIILSNILDGKDVFNPIVDAFAETPLGDLVNYDRRVEIWNLDVFGPLLLTATADGWIERASAGSASDLDPRLGQEVLQSASLEALLTSTNLDGALNLFIALPAIDEWRAVAWFNHAMAQAQPLTPSQAERLGHLVLERHWLDLLGRIKDRLAAHSELRISLRVCASLLSPWDKWQLGVATVTPEEKWESFIRVAASLYPHGPDEAGVWERAGGRDGDLPRHSSGLESWRRAVNLVRQGARPQFKDLIAEMTEDYPSNPDLRFMINDQDFNPAPPRFGNRRGHWWWW